MSELTPPNRRSTSDTLWLVIITAILVIGMIVAIVFPLLNGN